MIVFATLFVCGGLVPLHRLHLWCQNIVPQKTVVLVVGTCNASCPNGIIHRIENSVPTAGHGNRRYEHLHNKLELWNLPYSRVVYYDIDTVLKPPVTRCAAQCHCQFCAVRDPVATWPQKSKTYFNGGFLVLSPNQAEYRQLRKRTVTGRRFAEQDVLNDHFKNRWCKLKKECNWLHHKENHPHALKDPTVWMVHE